MIQQIFAVMAPVLLISALGYLWDKRRMPFDTGMVSYLASNIGAPALLLSTLLARRPAPSAIIDMMLAASGLILIAGALGWGLLKLMRQPVRVYLPAMIFPNSGNMGIPLSMFAFGEAGLVAAVAFFATISVYQFTLGIGLASGRVALREVATSPVIWSLALAFALLSFDLRLPAWIANTVEVLAGLVIPLMMLSLGVSIARLKVTALGPSVLCAIFRLVAGFGVALAVCALLGLDGPARGAVLIQSAMPAAVFNYLFALRYDNRPGEVAGIVLISTLLSFATLPLLLAYVLG
jgi:predicted permease